MKISISWLKELVDLKMTVAEVIRLLPLRTISIKEETPEYFELDMKGYNRADLLSLRGVAYEIAAIADSRINFSEPEKNEYIWVGQNLSNVEISGSISSLASVYCIAEITGLKVAKSSEDWIKKLNESGVRSVNNLADITNLVMLEYGQPLHAFDTLKSQGIHVEECPFDGWKFTTLDGKERILKKGDILIRNRTDIIGLGGIMGGKNSEVTKDTNSIYLEAAIFDPINLRKTATRLGLQSEASKRFQHGLTRKRCLQALNAAIKMYESLGGKLTAITLVGNLEDKEKRVVLTRKRLDIISGINITSEDVETYLKRLNFKVAKTGENWEVAVPYFRLDIEIEDDVIEEIARMYGYEKIPAKQLAGNIPTIIQNSVLGLVDSLKQALVQAGLTEVQTYSYYSTKVIENGKLRIENLIRVLNPMSAETEYLRDNLWPNLLEATAKNIRQGFKDIAIFEIGKVYWQEDGQPKEGYRLAIALSNNTDNPIAELSAIAKSVATLSYLGGRTEATPRVLFHPTRFASLEKDGKQIGYIAEVHPRIVNKFGIEQRVSVLEITLKESNPLLHKIQP